MTRRTASFFFRLSPCDDCFQAELFRQLLQAVVKVSPKLWLRLFVMEGHAVRQNVLHLLQNKPPEKPWVSL